MSVIICAYREHKGYPNQDIGLILLVSLSVFTVNIKGTRIKTLDCYYWCHYRLDSGTLYVHGKHR
jgi:hypothetical protein